MLVTNNTVSFCVFWGLAGCTVIATRPATKVFLSSFLCVLFVGLCLFGGRKGVCIYIYMYVCVCVCLGGGGGGGLGAYMYMDMYGCVCWYVFCSTLLIRGRRVRRRLSVPNVYVFCSMFRCSVLQGQLALETARASLAAHSLATHDFSTSQVRCLRLCICFPPTRVCSRTSFSPITHLLLFPLYSAHTTGSAVFLAERGAAA